MLELEVVPERSIGCEQWEFILGMHFSQAVAIIQSQVGIIKGVQVHYSDTCPLDNDLILHLPEDGIRFVFDAIYQRLKLIEVFNMKLVKLKYSNIIFNSSEISPTIQEIEQCFGATHPGNYDNEKQMFTLTFRGVSFCFDIDSKFQPGISQCGLGSLQFTTGVTPSVSKMFIYFGSSLKNCNYDYPSVAPVPAVPLPICCYHGLAYVDKAFVLRDRHSTKGILLNLYLQGSGSSRRSRITIEKDLYFGITCQDVTSLLGTPSQVFYKSEDKMKIHSPNAHNLKAPRRSDYFFNYFSLGLDVLFDAKTRRMKKFILHTNYPGHYNFNMYHRCNFSINMNAEKQVPDTKKSQNANKKRFEVVNAYTKWDEISEELKLNIRPVVLNRSASANNNPFGSTFCYGYQDMIFEVMQNQHIASVTFHKTIADIMDV